MISVDECKRLEILGANEWQATQHLTDEEFRNWYITDNITWWNEYRKHHKKLLCEKCNLEITNPEVLGTWGGINYHISCMIEDLSERNLTGDYKLLFERIARVFR